MSELFSAFNPMKILHYSDRIKPLVESGQMPIPAMVSFDFANSCNHTCDWCSWQKHRREEGGFLDDHIFASVVNDMLQLGIKGSEVCGGGEGLLHPSAHKFIRTLGSISDLLLVTNGSLLTKSDADFCKVIRVSLDAATQQTHEKLHHAKDFNQIIQNVKMASKITKVGLGFLIHPENYREIPSFSQLARDIGCRFVQIRPCFTDYPEVKEKVGFDWFDWVNTNNVPHLFSNYFEINSLIEQAKLLETEDFKVYATLYKTKPKQEWKFNKCYASWFNPLISPTGGVWICCERRGVPDSLIGTIGKSRTFKQIWFSQEHKNLIDKCPNALCPSKDKFLGYNEVIHKAYIDKSLDLDWI